MNYDSINSWYHPWKMQPEPSRARHTLHPGIVGMLWSLVDDNGRRHHEYTPPPALVFDYLYVTTVSPRPAMQATPSTVNAVQLQ